jgi:hypothetical protein
MVLKNIKSAVKNDGMSIDLIGTPRKKKTPDIIERNNLMVS